MKEEKRCPGHTRGVYIIYFYIHMWLSVLNFPVPAHQCAIRWNATCECGTGRMDFLYFLIGAVFQDPLGMRLTELTMQ